MREKEYKTDVSLDELKGHYEVHFLSSDQFIDLVKLWHEKELEGYIKVNPESDEKPSLDDLKRCLEQQITKAGYTPNTKRLTEDRPTREPIRIREDRRKLKPPPPPERPLGRMLTIGCGHHCKNCNSSMPRSGLFALWGKRFCINEKCPNSKK